MYIFNLLIIIGSIFIIFTQAVIGDTIFNYVKQFIENREISTLIGAIFQIIIFVGYFSFSFQLLIKVIRNKTIRNFESSNLEIL